MAIMTAMLFKTRGWKLRRGTQLTISSLNKCKVTTASKVKRTFNSKTKMTVITRLEEDHNRLQSIKTTIRRLLKSRNTKRQKRLKTVLNSRINKKLSDQSRYTS